MNTGNFVPLQWWKKNRAENLVENTHKRMYSGARRSFCSVWWNHSTFEPRLVSPVRTNNANLLFPSTHLCDSFSDAAGRVIIIASVQRENIHFHDIDHLLTRHKSNVIAPPAIPLSLWAAKIFPIDARQRYSRLSLDSLRFSSSTAWSAKKTKQKKGHNKTKTLTRGAV